MFTWQVATFVRVITLKAGWAFHARGRSTTQSIHRAFVQEGSLGPGEPGLIAFAGRPDPVKGLDVLFRALALLPGSAN